MRKTIAVIVLFLLSHGQARGEDTERKAYDCSQPLSLIEPLSKYRSYDHAEENQVRTVNGYGIYPNGSIPEQVMTVADDGSLDIDYVSPKVGKISGLALRLAKSNVGRKIVIRREFKNIVDLSRTKGIEVVMTVENPTAWIDVHFAVSDLFDYYQRRREHSRSEFYKKFMKMDGGRSVAAAGRHGNDTLWEYEIPDKTFFKGGRMVLRIPYGKFERAQDERDYRNSGSARFHPSAMIGYELSIQAVGPVKIHLESVKCY